MANFNFASSFAYSGYRSKSHFFISFFSSSFGSSSSCPPSSSGLGTGTAPPGNGPESGPSSLPPSPPAFKSSDNSPPPINKAELFHVNNDGEDLGSLNSTSISPD